MRSKVCSLIILTVSLLCANDIFFGVQTHFGQFRRADMDSLSMIRQLDLCREAGIQIIRDECLWSDVETDSGVYTIPRQVENYVSAALERNIDIYMILNYNNTIYAPSNGSGVTTEKNRIAFARYCQAVVGHFAPLGITHYEIWNEPNHGVLFWTPEPDPEDYTLLLQTAYDSIKSTDPDVTVIGCATSPAIGNPDPYIEGLDFIRDVFGAGGGDYMDAVSFHLYQVAYPPENEFRSYMDDVKSLVGNKPVYFSEFGYPTHNAWPNISLKKQAQYISRMFLTCLMEPQLRSAIYYDLKNDGTNSEEPEHNFGILEFDRTPKPSYHALKTLISHIDTLRPSDSQIENDRFILTFNDTLSVLWSFSGNKDLHHAVSSPYILVKGYRGDTLAFHLTANDSIRLSINESPQYLLACNREPLVGSFAFDHGHYLLYPGEEIRLRYTAKTADNIPLIIDPGAVSWENTGNSGELSNNRFTAGVPGKGMIIAEIQGIKDSVAFSVIEDPGIYTVETFDDTAGFYLESSGLDADASFLSPDSTEQRKAMSLHYKFDASYAIVSLYKNILINHYADSLFFDLYTGDERYEFRIYCRDADNRTHLLGIQPRPTDWHGDWGSMIAPLRINESAAPPVYIEKIYMKITTGETSQSDPCTGKLILDNLRIKRGDVVGISPAPMHPGNLRLSQSYPNPFNNRCRISYTLPYNTAVRLDIMNLRGQVVATPLQDFRTAGSYHLEIEADALPSGLYIYRLSTPHASISKKLVHIK